MSTSSPPTGSSAAGRRLPAGLVIPSIAVVVLLAGVALGVATASQGPGASSTPQPSPTLLAVVTTEPSTASLPPSQSPSPRPTPIPTPRLVPAPLTGLLVSPEAAGRHVIAVMVDDHSAARPQSGFNAASMVWQAPAEGGIPRYMMWFQGTVPAGVGPVRSAREYFIEWASEWRAVYAHAGGSPQALETLRLHGSGAWVFNADEFRWGSYFWRVAFNVPPHNLYTDGDHLEALAKRLGATARPGAPVWRFLPDVYPAFRPTGGRIRIDYPTEEIAYRYDAATNSYVRYVGGSSKPQVDAADHHVVAPKNVVILRMSFGPLNDGHPQKHRLEAQDVGHGDAWIASNGVTIHGTWRKASPTAPTLLFGPDGLPVTLAAGQTFVQVIALDYPYSIDDGTVQPSVMHVKPDPSF